MTSTNLRRTLLPAGVLLCGSLVAGSALAEMRPIQIPRAVVIDDQQMELFGNLAYESSREPGNAEYDNTRVGPLGMRIGVGSGVEVGGHLVFNDNSGDGAGDPDESGLEALTAFAKIAMTRQLAVETGVRLVGDDETLPYPMDGVDFYVNLLAEQPLGERGKVYGELGLTVQDDFGPNDNFGGTYENWGIGYAHQVNQRVSLNAELVGDAAPTVYGAGNHMDLVLGGNVNLSRELVLKPYASVGVYDASPDFALGVGLDFSL